MIVSFVICAVVAVIAVPIEGENECSDTAEQIEEIFRYGRINREEFAFRFADEGECCNGNARNQQSPDDNTGFLCRPGLICSNSDRKGKKWSWNVMSVFKQGRKGAAGGSTPSGSEPDATGPDDGRTETVHPGNDEPESSTNPRGKAKTKHGKKSDKNGNSVPTDWCFNPLPANAQYVQPPKKLKPLALKMMGF